MADRGHHERGEERVAEGADMDVVGHDLVGDQQQERVREQDEQEAGDEHERQRAARPARAAAAR
jgi:hypothetical protein